MCERIITQCNYTDISVLNTRCYKNTAQYLHYIELE